MDLSTITNGLQNTSACRGEEPCKQEYQDDVWHCESLLCGCFEVWVDHVAGGHVIAQGIVPRMQQVAQMRSHKECPVIPPKVRRLGYLYCSKESKHITLSERTR